LDEKSGKCKPCQEPQIQSHDGKGCEEFETIRYTNAVYYGGKVNGRRNGRGIMKFDGG